MDAYRIIVCPKKLKLEELKSGKKVEPHCSHCDTPFYNYLDMDEGPIEGDFVNPGCPDCEECKVLEIFVHPNQE